MKKKLLTLLLAVLAMASLSAQEGEIIYTDYGPEGWAHEFIAFPSPLYDPNDPQIGQEIDFDQDGINDLYYRALTEWNYMPFCMGSGLYSYYLNTYWFCEFNGIYEPIGDTISNIQNGHSNPCNGWNPFWHHHFAHGYWEGEIEMFNSRYLAFRVPKDDGYCYGWIEHSIEFIRYYTPLGDYHYYHDGVVRLYRWAYCTIPNYPFRVGQTSFEWDAVDHTAESFASIQPNPTTGMVTVRGKNLRQIEVYDALGQRIASLQAGDGDTTIDLGGQPAGIYFVNLTYQDGKRSVKKVVRQ